MTTVKVQLHHEANEEIRTVEIHDETLAETYNGDVVAYIIEEGDLPVEWDLYRDPMKYPHTDLLTRPNLHWFTEFSDMRCINDEALNMTGYVHLFCTREGHYHWEILNGTADVVADGHTLSPTLAQTTVEHTLDALREAL